MAKRDYYEVLGVGRNATDAQIKAAYRKLARKFHPDVNKAPDASAKFREATEAYEVLGDPQKRGAYDQFGHAGPQGFGGFRPGPGGPRSRTWTNQGQGAPVDFDDMFGGGQGFSGMGLDDLMDALRGGASRGQRRGQRQDVRGQDAQYELNLDFMQAVRGATTSIRIEQPDGSHETIQVRIPAGVQEGSRIRVRDKGGMGPGGRGDLYIVTHVGEHAYFRRQGNDLYVTVPISVTEAALGAKVDAPTLDGMMTLTVPPGSGSGRKLRVTGKGVAAPSGATGDLYVELSVVPPPSVSEAGAKLLREFDSIEKFDPRRGVPWK